MDKKIISFCLSCIIATGLFASNINSQINTIKSNAVNNETKNLKNQNKIDLEAEKVILYVKKALVYLNKNKPELAKKEIKKAIGDLSDLLTKSNKHFLIPIHSKIRVYEFKGNINNVKFVVKNVEQMIKNNKLPAAREVLNTLRDEIVIKTINIPLISYPTALNLSLKYINANQIETAKEVLSMVISTLVEIKKIIPISLIKAQALIKQSQIELNKNNKENALKILKAAKNEINKGIILGYINKDEKIYKYLLENIKNLENKIENNSSKESINNVFEKIIQKFKSLKEKLQRN